MAKFKRGNELTLIETGATVYFYREREDGMIIVSNDKNFTDVFEAKLSDLKPSKQKQVSSIQSKPKELTEGQKSDKKLLNEFFKSIGSTMPTHCQNCGGRIWAYTPFAKRCSSAHILPKEFFKEIQCDENNIVFMGSDLMNQCNGCHDTFDASVENRIKMPIYPLILERFELLKPKIKPENLKRAHEYLNIPFI